MMLDDLFNAYLGWCPKFNEFGTIESKENNRSYRTFSAIFTLITIGMIGIAIVNVINLARPFDGNIEVTQAFLYTGATLFGNFARIFWNIRKYKFSQSDLIQIWRIFSYTFAFVVVLSVIMGLALPNGSYWLAFPVVYFSYSLFIRVLGHQSFRDQSQSSLISELIK
jgi:hypothetical protein